MFIDQIKLYLQINYLNLDYSIITDKTGLMVYGINTVVYSYPEKISWIDCVRNVVVLRRVKEKKNILKTIKKGGKVTGLVTCCVGI